MEVFDDEVVRMAGAADGGCWGCNSSGDESERGGEYSLHTGQVMLEDGVIGIKGSLT